MLRELIFSMGGVKVYAEVEDTKKVALLRTIASMVRKAFTPLSEREVA